MFVGPCPDITEDNTHLCGVWIRDQGTFLKKILGLFDVSSAWLKATIKYNGQNIGTRCIPPHGR